jgi:phosphatidylinositol alpha-1,6-mannosyltransferase
VAQIPPGVDEQALHPGLDGGEAGVALGIPPEAPVVLYAGQFGRSATVEALVEAAEICCRGITDVRFVFAYRTFEEIEHARRAAATARLEAAGWGERVIMQGTVPQMQMLIARADVCILPLRDTYRKVDLPVFLLEAMAMAKPIVVTGIPPLTELLADPVGLAVPVDDGPALAEAIQRMLTDGRASGLRGRQVVEQRYTLRQMASRYEALYGELV